MRKTYVYRNGEMVEKHTTYTESVAPMVMNDIQPYKSMIDGTMIQSRSKHREHLRDNGCFEIGNEKMETKINPPSTEKRREVLRAQLDNMSHDQANQIMQSLRNDSRNYTSHRK